MKRLLVILFSIFSFLTLNAQEQEPIEQQKKDFESEWTNEFLDTVQVKKTLKLNDYSMIGVQYGVSLSQVVWNYEPSQIMQFNPVNFGVTYTIYGKMFGYMPYFGFQVGAFYTREGHEFEYDEDKKSYSDAIENAVKARMDVLEIPVLTHLHFDFWHFKIIAQLGLYGGYRMNIKRFPATQGEYTPALKPETANSFASYEKRWDYGIKGGLGFGLVFDPMEIHIQAMYKHSMSTLHEPNYRSQYYYRFGYPSNIVLSAGVHFHLTKRSGATKKDLKEQARKIVYEITDNSGKGR